MRGKKTGGRKVGSYNKTTRRARELLVELIDLNADRVQGWLDEIAEKHGALEAMRAYSGLLEYSIPKLARTENVGDAGGPQKIEICWRK